MTILRDPSTVFFPTITFTRRQAIHLARAGHQASGLWEQLLNNERTELGAASHLARRRRRLSLEEGLRRKRLHLRQLHDALPLGGRVDLRRVAARMPSSARRTTSPTFWFLGVRRTAGRVDYLARAKARDRFDAVPPSTREHESVLRSRKRRASFVSSLPSTTLSTSSSTALRAALFEESAPPPDELTDEVAELRRRSVGVTEASAAQRHAQKELGKQRRRDRKIGLPVQSSRQGTPAAEERWNRTPLPRPKAAERRGGEAQDKREGAAKGC